MLSRWATSSALRPRRSIALRSIGVSIAPGQIAFDADALAGVVHGCAAGEAQDGVLAGGVRGLVVLGAERVGRRDVHDRATLAGVEHGPEFVLHGQEHAAHVDGHHPVEVVVGALGERHGLELDRCGIHRAVKAAVALDGGIDDRCEVRGNRHVTGHERHRTRSARARCEQAVGAGVGQIGGHDVGAGADERGGDRTSHSPGRTGDDGRSATEIETGHGCSSVICRAACRPAANPNTMPGPNVPPAPP